jgi:two-component system nitrogen regulation sensor histidine kinase NtrY
LINLFENAVEAMRDATSGKTIELTTRYNTAGPSVEIGVEDEGRGVAPEDFDKIFLPAFSRKKGGTGLGLAIVHRIVLDHGGHIFAAPRQPKGTRFTIVLPA